MLTTQPISAYLLGHIFIFAIVRYQKFLAASDNVITLTFSSYYCPVSVCGIPTSPICQKFRNFMIVFLLTWTDICTNSWVVRWTELIMTESRCAYVIRHIFNLPWYSCGAHHYDGHDISSGQWVEIYECLYNVTQRVLPKQLTFPSSSTPASAIISWMPSSSRGSPNCFNTRFNSLALIAPSSSLSKIWG